MLKSLMRSGKVTVWFHGIDAAGLPVVSFEDARRRTAPFAINRLGLSRGTTDPHPPVRGFTDYELDHIDPDDHELLCRCKEVT